MNGSNPGVWFLSLDASSSLAARIGRWRWRLNYFLADMQLKASEEKVRYWSQRLWPGAIGPGNIEAVPGDLISALDRDLPAGQAVPGTLEHFLAERYFLYMQRSRGDLYRGQVHHRPYPLREARLLEMNESLLKAADITPRREVELVLYSEGVNVEVFRPQQVPT